MSKQNMQALIADSYLAGGNATYLEDLYEQFLKDPQSISTQWREYFQQLSSGHSAAEISHADIQHQFRQLAKLSQKQVVSSADIGFERKQAAVERLITAYRTYGYLIANNNPIPPDPPTQSHPHIKYLELASYPELSITDLDQLFCAEALLGTPKAPLRKIIATLNEIYCGNFTVEYNCNRYQEEVEWLQSRIEHQLPGSYLSADEKRNILKLLTAAEGLEKYLGNKYTGQTRFSLEGGDSFIPLMHAINERAALQGIKEVVVGMAHRGRLNVLINIFGKPATEIFAAFEGRDDYGLTSGDVKYHLGYASDIETQSGLLHLSLAFNPSHLEYICPVLMGSVRARQHRREPQHKPEVMAVMIHGDASVTGQGVVMETLSMSQTHAHKISGSIHIIINNQVGFTASDPCDMRSSLFCSDPARMIDAPVFHVNGDDPEAVVHAALLAVDYRKQFGKDVFIDLICYRRLGHNEADEPSTTQPVMYQFIRQHSTPRALYAKRLIAQEICTQTDADEMLNQYREDLDNNIPVVKTHSNGLAHQYATNWKPYFDKEWTTLADTTFDQNRLIELAQQLESLPAGFELQRQVNNIMEARAKMTAGEAGLDWGYAETMAYATLLDQGYSVRLLGQEAGRGVFYHRHATLHDQKTSQIYVPLKQINSNTTFDVYDSLLSEEGALGYEYGYASADPKPLVLWEAEYGDFVNVAQVIIDQFISSAWQKWKTLCGLTLLLPHGYEGAGPEHSSARLERFLQLCAQDNIQVCIPSTPAQIFHLLRRQVIRLYRTPLIVLTPKSMLRHKLATSQLQDLSQGHFQLVIPETDDIKAEQVKRVILCSGKIYYDLLARRREQGITTTVLLRIEQLYPFPQEQLQEQLKPYQHVKDIVWCQEEPENQGAWYTMRHYFVACLNKNQQITYVGRPSAASPSAGYMKLHTKEQEALVNTALI